jgi:hypothetical protein
MLPYIAYIDPMGYIIFDPTAIVFFREIDPWAHLRASRPGKRGAFGRPMAAGSLDMTCLKRASS